MAGRMSENRADALFKKANTVLTDQMAGISITPGSDPENYESGQFGGIMNPDQFRTFHEWIQDGTMLLQRVRHETLNAPIREIDKMGIGTRVLHGRNEAEALLTTQYAKPEFGKVMLDTTKFMAQLNYSYETVEDNIERGGWQTRVMRQLAERVAIDLEELIVRGDKDNPDPDVFLDRQNGLIKRLIAQRAGAPWEGPLYGGHLVDEGTANIDQSAFVDLMDAVPGKYWRNRGNYIFLTSPHLELAWRENLIERQTTLGDYFVLTNNQMVSMGVPVLTSPHIPEGMMLDPVGGKTGPALVASTHPDPRSSMLFLLDPQNIILGTWRRITIETDRDIEAQIYKVVLSMRIGITLEEPDAIGVAFNIGRAPTAP